jgi:ribosomal protein L3 glutamine methyltransferase
MTSKKKKTEKSFKPDMKAAAKDLHTVRDFIRYAVSCFSRGDVFFGHGTFNAYDEAVFLILEGLRLPIEQLEPYLDARLLPDEKKRLAKLIHDRVVLRKPSAHLVQRAYLKGVPFYVDERVIVPRSYIADLLFEDVIDNNGYPLIADPDSVTRVLDLCTGSGCLAILAAMIFENAEVDAVDLSKDAAAVAKINFDNSLFRPRLNLYQGDLFQPVKGRKYDFIITNPPYVDASDMKDMPREYLHEPRMALAAGRDGLDIVHRILKEAPKHLNDGGHIICEIGYGREALEESRPDIDFLWLGTENSYGEVFWLSKDQLVGKA